jgi:thiol-disulfide isomerase/thioredoxin
MMWRSKIMLIIAFIIVVGLFIFITGGVMPDVVEDAERGSGGSGASESGEVEVVEDHAHEEGTPEEHEHEGSSGVLPIWMTTSLKDVNSGEIYTISDFEGKPVLLESFAVWCPTCTRQQKITKEYHEEVGESVISIALDTDPNEDEDRVKEHTQSNGFDWRYSVAPTHVTTALIDDFGTGIVSAPSVPMVLICPDQRFRKLGSGIKDVDELKKEVASC